MVGYLQKILIALFPFTYSTCFSICRTAFPVTARVLAGDVKASVAVVVTLLIIAYY
jgi:hypothetical protein